MKVDYVSDVHLEFGRAEFKPEHTGEVLVLAGDHPEPRMIRTGRQDSANIEVLDGLKEGELIVLGDSLSAEAAGEAEAASSSSRRRGPPPGGH